MKRFFATPQSLQKNGILGMNRRNLQCIAELNDRSDYPKADDKILTKHLAQQAGVAVPEMYMKFEYTGQLRSFQERLKDRASFVIKPARGAGGEGVLVIDQVRPDCYLRGRERYSFYDLRYHCTGILHGLYSLGGRPDKILIEEKVAFDPIFEDLTISGVPDIRLVVIHGVPIMAMLRLPTYASRGRANLHQGAVGVGVDIATGKTTSAVFGSDVIHTHPDTNKALCGLELPRWQELLRIAAKCYDFSGLGYMGVDLVYDEVKGPLLLEINARPGLAIQIANQKGLLSSIKRIESVKNGKLLSLEDRLELAHTVS